VRRVAAAALVAAAVIAGGCGGGGGEKTTSTATAPPPATTTAPPTAPAGPERTGVGLTIGLTEPNASLIRVAGDGPQPPPELQPWRDRVTALRPQLYRMAIDWAGLQPDPTRPAKLDIPADGCLRGRPPCGAFAGIRDTFAAVASQQRAHHDFKVVVVFYGVPDWAAAPPSGCERPGIQPRSRPINEAGLEGYRALIRQVAALAREQGADVRWWSPWNEPNGAFFISPQRATCSTSSPPVSTTVYTRLFRAMRNELADLPGDQQLVLGDLAGVAQGSPRGAGSGEFVRALPDDVICGADVIAQHDYANLPGQQRRPGDPVAAVKQALAAHPCADHTPMWITETGVGGLHAGDDRQTGPQALRRQCVYLNRKLRQWYADPRIEAAFQYTFREDTAFPVGLADAGLTRTYPTYDLLKAWSTRAHPDDPPPALPDRCQG
jgi:hypothetical protein